MFKKTLGVCGLTLALGVSAVALPASCAFAQGGEGISQEVANKKVSLTLENADLRYALKLLFSSAGVNSVIDNAAQGVVTVTLQDVPFRVALESVLRSVSSTNPLTYRVENGVYYISPKVEMAETPMPDNNDNKEEVKPKTRIKKIQINFADAIDIATALGGTIITSRFQSSGGGSGFGGSGGFGGGGMGGGGFGGGGFGGGGFGGGGSFGGGGGGFGGGGGGFGGGRGGR